MRSLEDSTFSDFQRSSFYWLHSYIGVKSLSTSSLLLEKLQIHEIFGHHLILSKLYQYDERNLCLVFKLSLRDQKWRSLLYIPCTVSYLLFFEHYGKNHIDSISQSQFMEKIEMEKFIFSNTKIDFPRRSIKLNIIILKNVANNSALTSAIRFPMRFDGSKDG